MPAPTCLHPATRANGGDSPWLSRLRRCAAGGGEIPTSPRPELDRTAPRCPTPVCSNARGFAPPPSSRRVRHEVPVGGVPTKVGEGVANIPADPHTPGRATGPVPTSTSSSRGLGKRVAAPSGPKTTQLDAACAATRLQIVGDEVAGQDKRTPSLRSSAFFAQPGRACDR